MTHVIPGSEDSDFWTSDIDFLIPSTSQFGGEWTGFTVFFKSPGYVMEEKDHCDMAPAFPGDLETSGQAHMAKPFPAPPEPTKAGREGHALKPNRGPSGGGWGEVMHCFAHCAPWPLETPGLGPGGVTPFIG